MRSYARFDSLDQLPLDLLERELLIESRWYSSDIYDLLLDMAVRATKRLEGRAMYPVIPRTHTRKIICEEPRPMLPLRAWLIHATEIYSITTEDSTQEKSRTQLDSGSWDFDPNTDHIDWLTSTRWGWFDITGTWGVADSDIIERDSVAGSLVVDGNVLAGATALKLTTSPVLEGGELLYDSVGKQALVVASASGTDVVLDQWGTPDRAIATGASLLLCGRIHPTFERFILLDAFLQAWRKISPLPIHSSRTDQNFDGSGLKREMPSEVLSAVEEWERLLDIITGEMEPMRMI